ncbi:unnamed protein product [Allacma fusca]|uniref:DUF4806 domain-containing protein n=1 Tax=Allacma fusca TaxID=39272 RepID=A0A8J2KNG6_9HEXA|nr:unnamed protein product [Allacma fusca]
MAGLGNSTVSKKKFAVVVFDETATCIVPFRWILPGQKKCYWPDISGPALSAILTNPNSVPKPSWTIEDAKLLKAYKTLRLRPRINRHEKLVDNVESDDSQNQNLAGSQHQLEIVIPTSNLFSCSGSSDNNAEVAITFDQQELEGIGNVILQEVEQSNSNLESVFKEILSEKIDVSTQTIAVNENKFQETVLRRLAELKVNQDNILVAIKQKAYGEFECDDYQAPIQPCSTENELMNLGTNLKNQEFLQQLDRYLTSFGGKDLKKTVNGILSRIISDELAKRTTFTGKGKAELEFRKFINIHQIVFRTARKNPLCKNEREADINVCIMDWFRFSSERLSRRSHKKRYEDEVQIVNHDDCRNSTGDVDSNSMRFDSKAANTNILSNDQGMECDDTFSIPDRSSIAGLDDSQIMCTYNFLDDDVEITSSEDETSTTLDL